MFCIYINVSCIVSHMFITTFSQLFDIVALVISFYYCVLFHFFFLMCECIIIDLSILQLMDISIVSRCGYYEQGCHEHSSTCLLAQMFKNTSVVSTKKWNCQLSGFEQLRLYWLLSNYFSSKLYRYTYSPAKYKYPCGSHPCHHGIIRLFNFCQPE